VVKLDDHPNSIPKTQPLESLKCQTWYERHLIKSLHMDLRAQLITR
jgi:hypothetical protein